MITIYDIAKHTGFSPTTVSKVLNNYSDVSAKTRAKIMNAANELGYVPNANARSLTTKRSWTLGILFEEPSGLGIRHPFFVGVLDGFKKAAASKGYDLMFISKEVGERRRGYLEHCKVRGVEGVVVFLPDYQDPDFLELLHSDIPCVMMDVAEEGVSTLCSDNLAGAEQAVEYLYGLGHRLIGHITGGGSFAGILRKQGYERTLLAKGIPVRPEYIVEGEHDYSVNSGYRAMQKLLEQEERPTAVFVASDSLALGAMRAIKDQGLSVPEDISIIGFDDIEMARYLTPALTTIRQDVNLLGSRAADVLIYSIENGHAVQVDVIPVELVIRDSCKALQ